MLGGDNVESVKKEVGNITITVDYRTELLGIIMLLSDYPNKFPELFAKYNNQFYVDRILSKFSQYKNEQIILMFNELVTKHIFCYDAPFALFLQLDEKFNNYNLNEYVLASRLNGDKDVYLFLNELDMFSRKIDFESYYNSNMEEYKKYIDSISKAFEMYNITNFFDYYYGVKSDKKFIVNLSPFTTNGNYCCRYQDAVYCCLSVNKEMREDNLFDSTGIEKEILITPVHEFGHSYVNPITEKYGISDHKIELFSNVKLNNMPYSCDSAILNEHIIRVIQTRYMSLIYNDEELAKSRLEIEKNQGFIYVDIILDSLLYYENNRNKYPTFESYYPIILENIKVQRLNNGLIK